MNKIGWLIVFELSSCVNAVGQIVASKQIGVGMGLSFNALKSELISPYKHKGNSAPLQLYFRSGREVSRHHVQLQYFSSNLESISNGLGTNEEGGYLQYAFHRRVLNVKDRLVILGGVTVNAQVTKRTNLFYGSTGNNIAGELIASLSPSLLVERSFKRDKISAQLWSPVFAFLYQQGYALGPLGGSLLSLHNFAELDGRISYDRHLSERWNARFDYQFQIHRLSKFETFALLRNQVMVSMAYKINK